MLKYCIHIFFIVCFSYGIGYSQENNTFNNLYNSGKYAKALEVVQKQLDEIYSKRVKDKRVPVGFISMKNINERVDLKELFRKRKAKGFFIEENNVIANLHFRAARCQHKLKKYEESLNHYYQGLRFKKVEYDKDDSIYYELSQVYKDQEFFNAYVNFLEIAYTLNDKKYAYSLELGTALYTTRYKKKALYHFKRYIEKTDDTIDPKIYLYAGNLSEDLARFLDTEQYYRKYLQEKPDDAAIHFALGYIAFKRTGNFSLATASFDTALELLPKKDIYRRSKSYEYKADMALHDLEFSQAIEYYRETIAFQNQILKQIQSMKDKIARLEKRIDELKTSLLKNQDFDDYEEYEFNLEEKGKMEQSLKEQQHEYMKLNAGKVRWNIAYAYEKSGKLAEAIQFYRQAISFNYNSNKARDSIIKLKLKIKRGY